MSAFEYFEETQTTPLQIRYSRGGDAPLVLLPGLAETYNCWRTIAPALAKNNSVWVPNLPGVGKSPLPAGKGPSLEAVADALYNALQAAETEAVTLAGHSMGGYVALAFLHKYPHMVRGLALVHSTPVADDNAKKEQREQAVSLLEGGKKSAYLKTLISKMFAPDFLKTQAPVVSQHLKEAGEISAQTLIWYNKAMAARPAHTELLRNTKVPVQWVLGAEDSIISLSDTLEVIAAPALSFLSVYERVGHASFLEAPERLISDLTKFARLCAMR